ncbi:MULTISPECIES: uracil-DNA glycosylase [Capnocytophaga]|uniref:Uracil-DNA glycosylase n=1 Tax=Capnocytophaga canis TaxID=1848903 RepID=A0A3A1YG71_9FLAO|nr:MULTISPECIES: uracil-DNA glycosylase [Capnocytophaga]ATA72689.1 uracil-DNA glycosylase [Capnocytophaga sp. H4358]ATA74789.1 uracil-DNA glycosylase [Capnocytophaga sp. H2931]RIY36279.1 uracil-DNA glycosylase [Capnocytophaga canis]CEN45111.1 uracil-DNA-glycosylase [Capnocytophaga canis]GIM60968.1 uracil-DNA glycosylase 2 [Capnocytophaga canis]
MEVNIHSSWKPYLISEFQQDYFQKLVSFIKHEYTQGVCYPRGQQIFAAFDYCPFENVKVVIIGQDPYHGVNQANGLCFSVQDGVDHPPSLINIFKELQRDLGVPYPSSGNLERWAKQGVLLLNATLTVRANQAGSHQNQGWETFTDAVIRLVSEQKQQVVFMLWGGYAKKKASLIDASKHYILTSGHPSPLSANRGYWFGNKHFSRANQYLVSVGKGEIQW